MRRHIRPSSVAAVAAFLSCSEMCCEISKNFLRLLLESCWWRCFSLLVAKKWTKATNKMCEKWLIISSDFFPSSRRIKFMAKEWEERKRSSDVELNALKKKAGYAKSNFESWKNLSLSHIVSCMSFSPHPQLAYVRFFQGHFSCGIKLHISLHFSWFAWELLNFSADGKKRWERKMG